MKSFFDKMDEKHKPKPFRYTAMDPCPDPACLGHFELRTFPSPLVEPHRPGTMKLICSVCAKEAAT